MKGLTVFCALSLVLASCATGLKANDRDLAIEREFSFSSERTPAAAWSDVKGPAPEVYKNIRDYAKSMNYSGSDIVACYTDGTEAFDKAPLVMGGTFHSTGVFDLFMISTGLRWPLGRFKKISRDGVSPEKYSDGTIAFEKVSRGGFGRTLFFDVRMFNRAGQISKPINCYLQPSG